MSQEYYSYENSDKPVVIDKKYNFFTALTNPAWVVFCFFIAQLAVFLIGRLFNVLNLSLISVNETIINSIILSIVYIITVLLVIFLPRLFQKLKHYHIENVDIGWYRLPKWSDILLTPASLIIYFILSALAIFIVSNIFPDFDVNQMQDVGFDNLNTQLDYILAFISLVIVVPIAEETLFRGYLYGKLRRHIPIWLAVLVVSVTFGALHGSWNVAIDTFVLSVILCILREMTEGLWTPLLLHMTKNGIAFYFLFINPILLSKLGG